MALITPNWQRCKSITSCKIVPEKSKVELTLCPFSYIKVLLIIQVQPSSLTTSHSRFNFVKSFLTVKWLQNSEFNFLTQKLVIGCEGVMSINEALIRFSSRCLFLDSAIVFPIKICFLNGRHLNMDCEFGLSGWKVENHALTNQFHVLIAHAYSSKINLSHSIFQVITSSCHVGTEKKPGVFDYKCWRLQGTSHHHWTNKSLL